MALLEGIIVLVECVFGIFFSFLKLLWSIVENLILPYPLFILLLVIWALYKIGSVNIKK